MGTLIQNLLNPTSSSITHPILKDTKNSPPLKIPELSHKLIKNPHLKEICKQGNLKEAFVSLSNILTDQTLKQNCFDEPYSLVLELCASKKALFQGQQIHAHILKSNHACDEVFLSTKLVFFYGKCGSLLDAQKVFDGMFERSVFTWNGLIGAYVTNGEPSGALELFWEMHVSGVIHDASTFACLLKACGEIKDLFYGAQSHGLATKLGFVSNDFVANSLVAMYTKCSDLNAAVLLFERVSNMEDVVSWNSIISAYNMNGQSLEALSLFIDMQMEGVTPSTYTFVTALQACEEPSFAQIGMEIHSTILKSSHYLDMYVANALVVMYTRSGKMGEATRMFNDMVEKDNVTWNSMLSGFVQNSLYSEALKLFHEMQSAGHEPDHCSVLSMIATSSRFGNLLHGMEIHAYAMKNGMDRDLQIGNSLIDMYAKCSKTNYMNSVFHRMPSKDYISWTTVVAGYAQNSCYLRAIHLFRKALMEGIEVDGMMIGSILLALKGLKCISFVKELHAYILRKQLSDLVLDNTLMDLYGEFGHVDFAFHVFESIEVKDVVSWTSMISCHVHNGLANEALGLFVSMIETGIESDSISLVSALSAAADLSALRKGKELHGFLIRKGFTIEGSVAGSLVDMYACCGAVENSWKVFTCVPDNDLVLWTSMINAYGMHGHGEAAVKLFRRMENENLIPDHISFLAVLNACSHSALVDEGRGFFEKMKCKYKLEPWPEHYVSLVDMLGRANHLDEAFHFVEKMDIEPTAAVWCALLGACRIHFNRELGEFAARKLLELDPWNPGNYVLVSNLYGAMGIWEDVEEVRMKMKEKGMKKDPACSWIEVGNKIHTFVARDKSHPESERIYEKLAHITETLEREGGYVAQTRFVLHNVQEEKKVKMLNGHSERLAIAYGLLKTPRGTPIRITKNLRVCDDCHTFSKLVSDFFEREIIVRDANRFHHFVGGACSCGNFW